MEHEKIINMRMPQMRINQKNTPCLLYVLFIVISLFASHIASAAPSLFIQNHLLRNITVKGSINGAPFKQLSPEEFMSLNTSDSDNMGTWLGIVVYLQTGEPEVHIIDKDYYSSTQRLGFRIKYGTHEGYSRKQGFAENSRDFLNKVRAVGADKTLMPFTLHIPLHQAIQFEMRKVNWIFQNRRYTYKDSTSGFTRALIKSQQAVQKHLFNDFSNFEVGFIAYNKRGSRRPNYKTSQGRVDIKALEAAGFIVLGEPMLDSAAGRPPQQVYIMNAGAMHEGNHPVSYGILRHITDLDEEGSGDNNINSLTPKDFAMFDALPERIPPVAGIIVLEKQTALSHVNILAKNRGTMNISLNSLDNNLPTTSPEFIAEHIQGFTPDLYNHPIRLTIVDEHLLMEESTQVAVDTYFDKVKSTRNNLPIEAPLIVDEARWLLNPSKEKLAVNQVGAKAANYGLIQSWLKDTGLVMPSRAIGFNLYLSTIEITGSKGKPAQLISELISEKDNLSTPEINKKLANIQAAIQAIPLAKIPKNTSGKTVIDEVQALLDGTYTNVGRIRFRSSTNAEDLPTFNGAGLYESAGFTAKKVDENGKRIINKKKMWKKLKLVLSSLWLARAYHEREFFGIDHSKVAMAIQINPAFSNQWMNGLDLYEWSSGVVLYNEKGGDRQFYINSQFGESSVTNPLPGELPESIIIVNDELKKIVGRSTINGTQYEIFVSRDEDKIIDSEMSLLAQLKQGVKIIFDKKILENPNPLFSSPEKFGIDIEFKVMLDNNSGRKAVYIKQARPLRLVN